MTSVNAEDNRARLLEVAAHILATEGAGGLTVRGLARELGTSTMSLYSHFAGKAELIEATADEFVVRFGAALRAVPVTRDPLFDFACLANAYRSISLANRDLYNVAMRSGRLSIEQDTPHGIRELFDYCVAAVQRCIDAGLLAPPSARAGLLVFWTGVHGQVGLEMEQVFENSAQAGQAWATCLQATMMGLGADPARSAKILRRAQAPAQVPIFPLPASKSRGSAGLREGRVS